MTASALSDRRASADTLGAMQRILATLLAGRSLTRDEAARAFELILTGQANESQVAAMLALLQVKGVVLDELVGGARTMRAHVTPVPIPAHREADIRPGLIDTCGTGGAPKTFNISTAAAIVAAAAGKSCSPRIRVAKHGGRSRTGRGSAEVLAALGVNIDASPEVQARCLDEAGVCFSFAVHHHPAMKFAAGPRKSLGFPTVFNLLGPLCNPAGARRQLMGVYTRDAVELVARALLELGAEEAMVVHGMDGMDEITTLDRTLVAHVAGGGVTLHEIDARTLGITRPDRSALEASTIEESANVMRRVLAGEPGPARDIVALNAGAALVVGGAARDLGGGMRHALDALDRGEAQRTLDELRIWSNRV